MNYLNKPAYRGKPIARPATTLLLLLLLSNANSLFAQYWYYDFGTGTGSFNTAGFSTSFLPAAPDGTARVRVGTGGGGMELVNPGSLLGSGTEFSITAPSATSINKMGISDYTPGVTSQVRFSMQLNGTAGTFHFYSGNGSSFTDDLAIPPAEAFAGMRWEIDNAGNISASVNTASGWAPLPAGTFAAGQLYRLEIYSNNAAEALYYDRDGGYEVPSNSSDIWSNGVLIANDVPKFGLANEEGIDSWAFYGENSPLNSASIVLDDMIYTNDMSLKILPARFGMVRVTSKGGTAEVSFDNLTESSVSHYTLQRSVNGRQYADMGQAKARYNTGGRAAYKFIDPSPASGTSYYRIRSTDNDGSIAYSDIVRLNTGSKIELVVYPNPVLHSKLSLEFSNLPKGTYHVVVYNSALQEQVRQELQNPGGAHTEIIQLPKNLVKGIYQVVISEGNRPVFSQAVAVQ
jgi:hypothetical protein